MNREEHPAAEEIGWHVIARGGDMTARVHGGMFLGQGPSGEISFEPVDGIVGLTLEGSQLKLTTVRAGEELLVPGEQPARAVLVSPQTHVSLCFRSHILDIDNDFALARHAGSSLTIEVIGAEAAAARRARGPVSAGRRLRSVSADSNRTIVVSEGGPSLWTSPADHLPRTEPQGLSPAVKRPLLIGGALFVIVVALLAVAVYLPTRLAGGPSPETARVVAPSDSGSLLPEGAEAPDPVPADPVPADPVAELPPAGPAAGTATTTEITSQETSVPASVPADTAMTAPLTETDARVSDALLDRFTVLISAERLPDRGTVDFMVETLRSLQAAYPSDARVPEALNLLAQRLLEEARAAYDGGDALQAGRLIELAVTTGAAPSAVEEALADMTRRPAAPVAAPDAVTSGESRTPSNAGAAGLDTLVHQATGVALGALVVDPAAADADGVLTLMLDAPAADPSGAVTAPDTPGTADTPGPMDTPGTADTTAGPADTAGTADQLPTGFALEDSAIGGQPPGPVYRAFDQLTVTRRDPLVYPSAAPRRRSGSVDVSFTISESGDVVDVTAESDLGPVFVEAARETIARWRFEPVLVNGQPAPVKSAIRVTYRD